MWQSLFFLIGRMIICASRSYQSDPLSDLMGAAAFHYRYNSHSSAYPLWARQVCPKLSLDRSTPRKAQVLWDSRMRSEIGPNPSESEFWVISFLKLFHIHFLLWLLMRLLHRLGPYSLETFLGGPSIHWTHWHLPPVQKAQEKEKQAEMSDPEMILCYC